MSAAGSPAHELVEPDRPSAPSATELRSCAISDWPVVNRLGGVGIGHGDAPQDRARRGCASTLELLALALAQLDAREHAALGEREIGEPAGSLEHATTTSRRAESGTSPGNMTSPRIVTDSSPRQRDTSLMFR